MTKCSPAQHFCSGFDHANLEHFFRCSNFYQKLNSVMCIFTSMSTLGVLFEKIIMFSNKSVRLGIGPFSEPVGIDVWLHKHESVNIYFFRQCHTPKMLIYYLTAEIYWLSPFSTECWSTLRATTFQDSQGKGSYTRSGPSHKGKMHLSLKIFFFYTCAWFRQT